MLLTPSPQTLKKYGLSEEEWRGMADKQGHVCFVCRLPPKKGRLHIDHDHVKGWKAMPPEKRKLHVRGLLCFWCNTRLLGRSINVEKAKNVLLYLEEHRDRINSLLQKQ